MPNHGTTTEAVTSKKYSRWRTIGVVISTAAILVLFVTVCASLYGLVSLNGQLMDQIHAVDTKWMQTEKTIAEMQETLRTTLQKRSDAVAVMQPLQHPDNDAMQAIEAQHLVAMARDYLEFDYHPELALKLLQAADQSLSQSSDMDLLSIRNTLAKDIAALQAIPRVDVTEGYMQLAILSDQIDSLPLGSPTLADHSPKPSEQSSSIPWWKSALQATWEGLQKIIVIRHIDTETQPFVAPDQQLFFYQTIKSQLAVAQWALLHHQQKIYQLSLTQIIHWIKQYAQPEAALTQQMLTTLTEWQRADIHPSVPDVSSALQALQTFKSKK